MRFGTWNIRSLYRPGSTARELARYKLDLLARYKLDLVVVKEVRWDKGGMVRAAEYIFYGKGNKNHQFGNRIFLYTTD
jgi:hypothetical protein